MRRNSTGPTDAEMRQILEAMLEADEDITARAVARRHSGIAHASSITRNLDRAALLSKYKDLQARFRIWRERRKKDSASTLCSRLAQKEQRIEELERCCEVLIASHVAMIRVVGEMGGIRLWIELFARYEGSKRVLTELGAVPNPAATELRAGDSDLEAATVLGPLLDLCE